MSDGRENRREQEERENREDRTDGGHVAMWEQERVDS